jgi:hypothetical protein
VVLAVKRRADGRGIVPTVAIANLSKGSSGGASSLVAIVSNVGKIIRRQMAERASG